MESDLDHLRRNYETMIDGIDKTEETSTALIEVNSIQTLGGEDSYVVVYSKNNNIGKLKVKEYQKYISDSHKYEFEVFGGDNAALGKFSIDIERALLLYTAEDIAKLGSLFKIVFRESTKEYKVALSVSMQLSYESKKLIISKKIEKIKKIQNKRRGVISHYMRRVLSYCGSFFSCSCPCCFPILLPLPLLLFFLLQKTYAKRLKLYN